ncbi:inactive leucine-rich repeat receptor-like serine/threonine-protein kinase At5g24100 [Typha latifolia]|uniref:inactive leucine-rich repeat receptor-like serine/threonine-protein kinase At5g24100 n=1 Tax=Typha latifolia TaxID=4733 RepID=UPI003C2EAF3A
MWRIRLMTHQQGVCILALVLFTVAGRGSSISESRYLYHFIQAIDPQNQLEINWDRQIPAYCFVAWMGIKCDALTLEVTEIKLENKGLSGRIDADSLCKLQSIQVVNLANNLITEVIPESISICTSLTYLNLSNNMLLGEVPQSLSGLKNLRSLDISNNNLTGSVPHFKQIIELSLHKTLVSILSDNNTNPHDNDVDEEKAPKAATVDPRVWVITFLVVFLLLTFLLIFVCFINKSHYKATEEEETKWVQESPERNTIATETSEDVTNKAEEIPDIVFFGECQERFNMDDLLNSPADLQGQNIYSSLYRVRLTESAAFAVKRLKNLQALGDDFKLKIMRIGKLKHPNLLPLVAFHFSEHDKLLIYRYQKSGSLSSLLSKYQTELPWRKRLNIMKGIARGLDYVEKELGDEATPHGNLKPSNILLSDNDEEETLISEYGIWSLLDPKWALPYSSNGYRAPEKNLTRKSDAFSLGVILLELLTGRSVERSGLDLPGWVKSMVSEEWTAEVFDKEVVRRGRRWAFPLLNVALKCVSKLPENRPDVSEVLQKIEHVESNQQEDDDDSCSSPSSVESNQQEDKS